jgi:hypothetical protein
MWMKKVSSQFRGVHSKALGKKRMSHIAALYSGKREVSFILEYYAIAL